jgi:hypothetical protein
MHRRRLMLLALVPLAVLAAGCGGGGGSPGVASVAASSTTTASTSSTTQNGLVAFSQCMRSNGVSSFPDPQRFADGNVKLTIHDYGAPTPRFQAALNACNHLLPSGPQQASGQTRTQLADQLSFARCMRSHGVANFPDPNPQEGLTVAMVVAQGIDVHSPTILRVVQKCLPASHGGLTAAKVKQAIDNYARGGG